MKMIVMRSSACAVLAACAAPAVVTLTGCSGTNASSSDGKLAVVASFYPLEFIAETVGGDAVQVTPLTAPGVEPHDLELTSKQVGAIAQAKVVLFEKDLQPAVDEAVTPEHQHAHDRECGHAAVEHGDHVGYVHDGHLHAAHGDHWDEH
jgi:zinc transport system substrate-binding protein